MLEFVEGQGVMTNSPLLYLGVMGEALADDLLAGGSTEEVIASKLKSKKWKAQLKIQKGRGKYKWFYLGSSRGVTLPFRPQFMAHRSFLGSSCCTAGPISTNMHCGWKIEQ